MRSAARVVLAGIVAVGTVVGLAVRGFCGDMAAPPAAGSAASTAAAGYVGSASCRPCHQAEYGAWRGSHHDLAMQAATAESVLGDFNDASLKAHDVQSTFSKRDGGFFVRTDGPDGKLHDYRVKFTFGVFPLQQYLVEFPGGRLQALSLAWDSRAKTDGGQRWFSLTTGATVEAGDALHWTGLYQNWNLQCAACHSTNLRKNYDAAAGSYATTYSEVNVACEACHGAGSGHAEWAAKAQAPYAADDAKGFGSDLDSRWQQAWSLSSPRARVAVRDRAAASATTNVCAPCHARRSALAEDAPPAAPLEDSYRAALLTSPAYFADGQQREEDYVWGSFVQSKMFERGVTCMDCHDAHSQKLRAEGNALCGRCHNAAVFDTKAHHFHEPGSAGAQCVECHMPARNYMIVDARRDHFIRVPRPDLSAEVGSPDVCSGCHAGRSAQWAADTMDRWYGKQWRTRPQDSRTLHAASTDGAKAMAALLELARDGSRPAIVRATATTLLEAGMRPQFLPAARTLLADPDAMVRLAALGLLDPFDAGVRASAIGPLLADPTRTVRTDAARALADVADENLTTAQRPLRAAALKEYVESQQRDADWPTANANLGNLYLKQGRSDDAVAAFERALKLDPRFAAGYVNLADAYRGRGRDKEGEEVLRRGLAQLPAAAALHHALGLLLVRKGDTAAGLVELARAVELAPEDARYAYVYAIGLHSTGKVDEALAVLRAADARHRYDPEILSALISINLEAGRRDAALPFARQIEEVMPEDPGIKRLLSEADR